MQQSRLFNHTRIQLTSFYAITIGLITLLSGYGIHLVMNRAFDRIVDRELNTFSGTVHDTLEAVLQQPEIVDPIVMKLLPGLCLVDRQCSPARTNSKIGELTQQQGYYLRLLNLKRQPIAILGADSDKFADLPQSRMGWQTITDLSGERYHVHTLLLQTRDRRSWGYLQVTQSFHQLDEYMHSLHLLLIFGVPLVMCLISGVSWWLSGLAMQPIYQSYDRVQQFTADAAHELRTPLAVARIAVESALDPTITEPDTHHNLEIAHRQVRHLTRLAEDLLWLSRLDSNQLPIEWQSCCLNDLVSDLEEELAPLAIAAEIDLRLEIPIDRLLYVNGDLDRLYRAIANLIDNAIQYTPARGEIIIRLAATDRLASVTIQDDGIGIAATDLPHIFDRFYRVQADRSRSTGGTGLGLAISKAIIQAHRGSIQVQSQIDRGTTFTVFLPAKIVTTLKIGSQY